MGSRGEAKPLFTGCGVFAGNDGKGLGMDPGDSHPAREHWECT